MPYLVKWVELHEKALVAHKATVHVMSLNVPSCPKGKVRGILWTRPDLKQADIGKSLATPNCLSKARPSKIDIKAFAVGYATKSIIPAKPNPNN